MAGTYHLRSAGPPPDPIPPVVRRRRNMADADDAAQRDENVHNNLPANVQGNVSVEQLLQLLQTLGARPAGPSEPPKLPSFDGKPSEYSRVPMWLARVRAIHDTCDLPEAKRVPALCQAFKEHSPAGVWFAKHGPTFECWQQFEEAFVERFRASAAEGHHALMRLADFRQRPQDSVSKYASALTTLLNEIELTGAEEFSQTARLTHFLRGLRPELSAACDNARILTPDLTLGQLEAIAINTERADDLRRGSRNGDRVSLYHMQDKPRRCGFCRSTDHTWDDCPKIAKLKAAGKWRDHDADTDDDDGDDDEEDET